MDKLIKPGKSDACRTSLAEIFDVPLRMYAVQVVLLLLTTSIANSQMYSYHRTYHRYLRPVAENVIKKFENKTIAELEQMQMERMAKMERTFGTREDKEKIDRMVLEELEKQAKEFEEQWKILRKSMREKFRISRPNVH
ncbi:unnamed protein product [Cylicocyclus nassatus]|uniref:Uncharacterized protein n=1 Tax=Cylicocyclus nassatus TaxID=53992 RepID=A0AA36GXL7_CYLNA|nr:unnamed protein product [Cylicocyclus nassatus]